MATFINIADLKDPNDPQGRSYRQVNVEKVHTIPIGALVEVNLPAEPERSGVRLFVVYHARDCDQTPLYVLGPDPEDTGPVLPDEPSRVRCGRYDERCLTVIRPPTPATPTNRA